LAVKRLGTIALWLGKGRCNFDHSTHDSENDSGIPKETESQKDRDAQLRLEEEAARIQPLKRELLSTVEAAPCVRKTATAARKKPRTPRKAATKTRKRRDCVSQPDCPVRSEHRQNS